MDRSQRSEQFAGMLSIAAAVLLSAPQPLNLRGWFTPDDVPWKSMESGKLYVVGFSLVVSPTGQVLRCELETKSGLREVDSRSCSRPLSRAKFKPAISFDGQPVHGVYRTHTQWIVAGRPAKLPRIVVPTMDLRVNRLPDGVQSPAVVRVMFAVNANGKPSSCMEEPPHTPDITNPQPGLALVACREIVRTFKAKPVKDVAGTGVPSVQDAIVRFTLN